MSVIFTMILDRGEADMVYKYLAFDTEVELETYTQFVLEFVPVRECMLLDATFWGIKDSSLILHKDEGVAMIPFVWLNIYPRS